MKNFLSHVFKSRKCWVWILGFLAGTILAIIGKLNAEWVALISGINAIVTGGVIADDKLNKKENN